MSEKIIMKLLRDSGLTERESKVYMFLAKNGVQKGRDISRSLKMHKAQVYRILNSLQGRGAVEVTLEFPRRFLAIPFERFLDLLIKDKLDEARILEDEKNEILAHWKSIVLEKPTPHLDKFVVIEGRKSVYSKILQMVEKADKEVVGVTTGLGLIQADQVGVIDEIEKRNIPYRLLIEVTKENFEIMKRTINKISVKYPNLMLRHLNLASGVCPRFVIKDGEEVTLILTPNEDSSTFGREYIGLWTNSEAAAYNKTFFEELWHNATDPKQKDTEIETGKPI